MILGATNLAGSDVDKLQLRAELWDSAGSINKSSPSTNSSARRTGGKRSKKNDSKHTGAVVIGRKPSRTPSRTTRNIPKGKIPSKTPTSRTPGRKKVSTPHHAKVNRAKVLQ